MAIFKSGNPALKQSTFEGLERVGDETDVMTIQGTVNKTVFLLLMVFLPAMFIWHMFAVAHDVQNIMPYFWVGLIGSLLSGFVLAFHKQWAPYLAVVYALCEGLVLGGFSALLDFRYPGIALQAFALTIGILIVLLVIYKLEIIRPSENFKLIVASATGGIAVFYLISLGLSMFHIIVPLVNDNSPMGIIFSLVVVVIAAMNLVVDFDFIEQGAANRAPKYMEWYGAFGLMVTLVWLYLELLRLLSKARSR
jgi:uncharacterized YccA/Bax inhibitor family protein